jgi:hypothetical protein
MSAKAASSSAAAASDGCEQNLGGSSATSLGSAASGFGGAIALLGYMHRDRCRGSPVQSTTPPERDPESRLQARRAGRTGEAAVKRLAVAVAIVLDGLSRLLVRASVSPRVWRLRRVGTGRTCRADQRAVSAGRKPCGSAPRMPIGSSAHPRRDRARRQVGLQHVLLDRWRRQVYLWASWHQRCADLSASRHGLRWW